MQPALHFAPLSVSLQQMGIRFFLSACLLAAAGALAAQIPSPAPDTGSKRLEILHADVLTYEVNQGIALQKLLGNVRLKQDSTYFSCDSAYFYESENRFEGFSRVKVEMPDNVVLTGRRAAYDGNTRIAEVYENIRLTDGESKLTTQRLTYYRAQEYGYYQGGGKLEDGESVLTSEYGYYYPNQDLAYFKRKVVLTHPDYTLRTDTLGYNTQTKVATFLTYTFIESEDGDLETTRGEYDTEAGVINLFTRSTVKDSSYQITADSLYYTDQGNQGVARGRVLIQQEDSSLEVRGEYGTFDRSRDASMITRNPVAIQQFEDDTLYIFADTLFTYREKRPPADSSSADSISFRIFKAYRNVRIFMNDLQGKADSMVYFYDDSVIWLYQDPLLWSDRNQLSGDTITVWMRKGEADSMRVGGSGFLVAEEDTAGYYNQIKGKELRAKFRDNQLARLEVYGNSESIYFVRDDSDSLGRSYEGMNQALAQSMLIYLEDNEVVKIVFRSNPEGIFLPWFEVLGKPNQLEGMRWRIGERPAKPPHPASLPPADATPPLRSASAPAPAKGQ
jgi:lipopolysaccharide export system protein LptA